MLTSGARGKRFFQKLHGRIRNGLIVQDLFDALGRTGIVVCPYFVICEPAPDAQASPLPPLCAVRPLTVIDAGEIARITLRPATQTDLANGLQQFFCLGLFQEGQLAAYTWASINSVPVPDSGGAMLFAIAADEAYFFDMYVAPQHRGSRLAALLRQSIQRAMAHQGRYRFYSITMAFNRSSRRFKARMGAQEMELRLYLQLRWGRLSGIDFRLRRWASELRSPVWTSVRASSGPADG